MFQNDICLEDKFQNAVHMMKIYMYKNYQNCQNRAVDKREYLVIIRDNFCSFCLKTYDLTLHLNRLDETVQMRGHNIWF